MIIEGQVAMADLGPKPFANRGLGPGKSAYESRGPKRGSHRLVHGFPFMAGTRGRKRRIGENRTSPVPPARRPPASIPDRRPRVVFGEEPRMSPAGVPAVLLNARQRTAPFPPFLGAPPHNPGCPHELLGRKTGRAGRKDLGPRVGVTVRCSEWGAFNPSRWRAKSARSPGMRSYQGP